MKELIPQLTPLAALILYVTLLGVYSYGVWQCAKYAIPIENQIEVNDYKQRLENCHWQLLERNAEVKTLTKQIELDSLINQNKDE